MVDTIYKPMLAVPGTLPAQIGYIFLPGQEIEGILREELAAHSVTWPVDQWMSQIFADLSQIWTCTPFSYSLIPFQASF
jgi:hypothetical protein